VVELELDGLDELPLAPELEGEPMLPEELEPPAPLSFFSCACHSE